MNDSDPLPDPPELVRRCIGAPFKVTKPFERISVEFGVVRDCLTPGGWTTLKANPRSKRLDEYRERWRKVDDFLAEYIPEVLHTVITHQRAVKPPEPSRALHPDTVAREQERLLNGAIRGGLYRFFHPHEVVRHWNWRKGRSSQEK
jgi:hypothetical protein